MKYRFAEQEFQKVLKRATEVEQKDGLSENEVNRFYFDLEILIKQFYANGDGGGKEQYYLLRVRQQKFEDDRKGFSAYYKLQGIIELLKSLLTDIKLMHSTHEWTQRQLDDVVNRVLPLLTGRNTLVEILSDTLYNEFQFLAKGDNGRVINTEPLTEYLNDMQLITYGTRVSMQGLGETRIEMLSQKGREVVEQQGGWLVKKERDRKRAEHEKKKLLEVKSEGTEASIGHAVVIPVDSQEKSTTAVRKLEDLSDNNVVTFIPQQEESNKGIWRKTKQSISDGFYEAIKELIKEGTKGVIKLIILSLIFASGLAFGIIKIVKAIF